VITTDDVDQNNNYVPYGPVQGSDLKPEWNSLEQTCQDTSKGIKCKLVGYLTVTNNTINTTSMTPSALEIYLSEDNRLSQEDLQLKHWNVSALKPGVVKAYKLSYTLPYGQTATGKNLIATILTEDSNPANNTIAYGPVP
jgi:hypothetical protein